MKFYRIEVSTDLNEVGVFPQRGDMMIGLHKDDPKHLFNQPDFIALPSDVHVPSFKLRSNAKLTDVLSFPINQDWIISEKLKSILEEENSTGIQFVPIKIFKEDEEYTYFLLRSLTQAIDCLDFSRTSISIMRTVWDEEGQINVRDAQEFFNLLGQIKLPKSIKINRPYIVDNCSLNFFSMKHVYGLFTHFVSEDFKEQLVRKGVTGIKYLELDEVV